MIAIELVYSKSVVYLYVVVSFKNIKCFYMYHELTRNIVFIEGNLVYYSTISSFGGKKIHDETGRVEYS